MRMSILNTATTEQMGYSIFSFFVYTKSTNQNSSYILRKVHEVNPHYIVTENDALP